MLKCWRRKESCFNQFKLEACQKRKWTSKCLLIRRRIVQWTWLILEILPSNSYAIHLAEVLDQKESLIYKLQSKLVEFQQQLAKEQQLAQQVQLKQYWSVKDPCSMHLWILTVLRSASKSSREMAITILQVAYPSTSYSCSETTWDSPPHLLIVEFQ